MFLLVFEFLQGRGVLVGFCVFAGERCSCLVYRGEVFFLFLFFAG